MAFFVWVFFFCVQCVIFEDLIEKEEYVLVLFMRVLIGILLLRFF